MPIKHGITVLEDATALVAPVTSGTVVAIVGTAPVNLLDDPSSAVNVPILANSATEAMAALGYSTDFANYTLCMEMYASANIYQVGPIVYINVLDPATHKTALSATTVQVNDMQATVEVTGVLKSGLTVLAGETSLTAGTDYTLSFDTDGYLVVTLIAGGAGASATSLTVSGNKIDPTAVTANDIIGTYNSTTGKETGLQLIRQIYPKLGVVPSVIIAPGFSQTATVALAMTAKAQNINGCFSALALIDLDTSTATKYTDVNTVKNNAGLSSTYSAVLWPYDKVGDYIFPKSVIASCMMAYLDAQNDDVPYMSPSNHMLGVTGQCLANGTEVVLDQDQGNTVNGYGVITAINLNGWRLWGNYTSAYPNNTDPKDMWLPVRRMFNWQANNFILTYFQKVDNPMNRRLIETIVDSENIRLGAYVPDKLAYAHIDWYEEDNPETDIISGNITFRQDISPYTPAQHIKNILTYNVTMLKQALIGGEE